MTWLPAALMVGLSLAGGPEEGSVAGKNTASSVRLGPGASVVPGSFAPPRGVVETRVNAEARFSAYLQALNSSLVDLERSGHPRSLEYQPWFLRELTALKQGQARAAQELNLLRKADDRAWPERKAALEIRLINLDRTYASLASMAQG